MYTKAAEQANSNNPTTYIKEIIIMSSIYARATIKCLLLIFMALATVNANSFFDKRTTIKVKLYKHIQLSYTGIYGGTYKG